MLPYKNATHLSLVPGQGEDDKFSLGWHLFPLYCKEGRKERKKGRKEV